jgi:hypothetical protein
VREGERGKGREFAQPVDGMTVEEKKKHFLPLILGKLKHLLLKWIFFNGLDVK